MPTVFRPCWWERRERASPPFADVYKRQQIDDYTANTLQAQLLYLDSVESGKDISIYINSPGGSVYAG